MPPKVGQDKAIVTTSKCDGLKSYFPVSVNNFQVITLLDSGSDISIMQKSIYEKVCKKRKVNKDSTVTRLTSFSNTEIKVLGEVIFPIKFKLFGKSNNLRLIVINDIDNTPNVLFGDDFLRQFLVNF